MRPIRLKTTRFVVHGTLTPPGRVVTVEDIDQMHKDRGRPGIGYHVVDLIDGTIEYGAPIAEEGQHVGPVTNPTSVAFVMVGGGVASDFARLNSKEITMSEVRGEDNYTYEQKKSLFREMSHQLTLWPDVIEIVGHHSRKNGASKWSHEELMESCPWYDVKAELEINGLWEFLQERKAKLREAGA